MDLRRLRVGEWIAALSGAVLLVSLVLPWYERGPVACIAVVGADCPEPREFSAFQALGVLDLVLLAVALVALAVWVVTLTQETPAIPIALDALLGLLGIVALAIVAIRLADVPELGRNIERAVGLYVALVAALGVVGGAVAAMRDERQPAAPAREVKAVPPPSPAESAR